MATTKELTERTKAAGLYLTALGLKEALAYARAVSPHGAKRRASGNCPGSGESVALRGGAMTVRCPHCSTPFAAEKHERAVGRAKLPRH